MDHRDIGTTDLCKIINEKKLDKAVDNYIAILT
jgi:hypothetical protein